MVTSCARFAGPLEIYAWPWWYIPPPQRLRGPSRRLTPRQVGRLISHIEYCITYGQTEYDLDEADSRDLIETIRLGRCIVPFDGEMPQPASHDSYNCFARRNPYMCLTAAELHERDGRPHEHAAAAQQTAWEANLRARQEAKETEAKRLWDAETSRRFWLGLSSQFIGQPFVQVRIGRQNTRVYDDTEPWRVRFEASTTHSVPEKIADLLVQLGSSRL